MTTTTMKGLPPETKADAATEPPSARTPDPEQAVPRASSETDLESRIKRRRAELIGRLSELRAGTGLEVAQAGDKLKAKLSEISHIVKDGVVDGWASLGDGVKHKLERWLSESERSPSAQASPTKNGRS